MNTSWAWAGIVIGVAVAYIFDPRKSRRNQLIYWIVPPAASFLVGIVTDGDAANAGAYAVFVLILMTAAYLRFFRSGPGRFNTGLR